jgi:hypothetical protein
VAGEHWTLLAPGPSLARLRVPDLEAIPNPKGPVVAVNNAILCPVPIDYWCAQDPPSAFEHVWKRVPIEKRVWQPVVWCPDEFQAAWSRLGYRTLSHPNDESFVSFLRRRAPLPRFHYQGFTIFTALARMYGMGASQIMVFGCDMANVGYGFGVDTRGRSAQEWLGRWTHERELFEVLKTGLEAAGTKVWLATPKD